MYNYKYNPFYKKINFKCSTTLAGPSRKIKRVSDVNAMGGPAVPMQPFMQNSYDPSLSQQQTIPPYINQQQPINTNISAGIGVGSNIDVNVSSGYNPNTVGFNQYGQYPVLNQQQPHIQQQQQQSQPIPPQYQTNPTFQPQITMFQQPIVQDMALQYGQKLADQGKQIVESHIEKYVPITRLKYYFAVDNKYVINKLRLLFFPYMQRVSNYYYY